MGFFSKVWDKVAEPLVGGVLGLGSTALGNSSAKQEAQISRDWQENLSNTAVQRRVADLKKAGLNPLLAVGNASSGASTPTGATADVKHFDPNSINLLSNARLLNAQARQIENDNELFDEKQKGLKLENRLKGVQADLMKAQTDKERVDIIQKELQNQGIKITNEQAWIALDKLNMINEFYHNGFTDEMFNKYPGLGAILRGENMKSIPQAYGFNSAVLVEQFFKDFENWQKEREERKRKVKEEKIKNYKPRGYNEKYISR